jgi:hypothetical protein
MMNLSEYINFKSGTHATVYHCLWQIFQFLISHYINIKQDGYRYLLWRQTGISGRIILNWISGQMWWCRLNCPRFVCILLLGVVWRM